MIEAHLSRLAENKEFFNFTQGRLTLDHWRKLVLTRAIFILENSIIITVNFCLRGFCIFQKFLKCRSLVGCCAKIVPELGNHDLGFVYIFGGAFSGAVMKNLLLRFYGRTHLVIGDNFVIPTTEAERSYWIFNIFWLLSTIFPFMADPSEFLLVREVQPS